jgi:hypothetical protein
MVISFLVWKEKYIRIDTQKWVCYSCIYIQCSIFSIPLLALAPPGFFVLGGGIAYKLTINLFKTVPTDHLEMFWAEEYVSLQFRLLVLSFGIFPSLSNFRNFLKSAGEQIHGLPPAPWCPCLLGIICNCELWINMKIVSGQSLWHFITRPICSVHFILIQQAIC